jgi:tetratricopeptide (TPR) repeat protein
VGTTNLASLNPKPVVFALLEKAERFAGNRECDHAAAFFRAAVAADVTPVARIAYGAFLADCERLVAARYQLLEAWEMAKRMGNPAARALACHNLAAVYRRLGVSTAADSFQQQAIRAQLEVDPLEPLPAFVIAGRALDWTARESVAAEKLLIAAQSDPCEEVSALLNSGVIAYRQGREALALERFYSAFEIAQAERDLTACAVLLTNIAHLQRDRGRWSTADECLALAEKIDLDASRPRSALRVKSYRRELVRGLAMLAADPSWN